MLGAIIGDIAGSRFEFNNARNDRFRLFTGECSFTDDTICTVAVADAILKGGSYGESIHGWCRRYPHPMGGYGGSFARWVHSDNPQPYGSFGNGSAMRVSPIGWLFGGKEDVEREAARSAAVTHDHPEGIRGAVTVAVSVWMMRRGCTKEELREYAESQYGRLPQLEFRPGENGFDESCMTAVPVSLSCFLASSSFEDAVRRAIVIGGDSDTIGAITGSIAEAAYGIPVGLKDAAMSYLPGEMKCVINQFYSKL